MKRRMLRIVASTFLLAAALPAQAGVLPGQLQISELMANPNTPIDLDGEWLELRNATDFALNLGTIRLQDAAGNFFEMPTGHILPAFGFFLFTRSNNPILNGGIVISDHVYTGNFSLNNGGDTVTLFSDGLLIDSVSYLAPAAGVSLNFTDAGVSYPSTNRYYDVLNHYGSPRSQNEIMAAIPEPETYALLLAGLGLLGFSASRKRSRKA
jgi:Lamin Tail Domain/PEP-CTERM motif